MAAQPRAARRRAQGLPVRQARRVHGAVQLDRHQLALDAHLQLVQCCMDSYLQSQSARFLRHGADVRPKWQASTADVRDGEFDPA